MPKYTGPANNWTDVEDMKKPFIAKNEAKIQKKKRKLIVHSNLQTENSDLINYFYRLAWAHEVRQLSHLINSQILAVLFVLQLYTLSKQT